MTVVATSPPLKSPLARSRPEQILSSPLTVYAMALAWTLLVRFPLLRLDGIDEVFYVEVAHLWTKGVLPYVGAFDVKPPGFFSLVAASQLALGPTLASARAVGVALDAVTATALFFLGRYFGAPRVAVFAAVVYPPLSELVAFNDFYSALGAVTTVAFLAALSPLGVFRRAMLAGLAAGAACSIKQTTAAEAIVVLFALVRAPDAAGRRTTVAVAFLLAASVVPTGFLAYFAWHGAVRSLIDAVIMGALRRPTSAAEGFTFLDGVLRFMPLHRSILPVFVVACIGVARHRHLAKSLPGAPLPILEGWLLAALLTTLAQRSMHVDYINQTLPPALLLSGLCMDTAVPEFRRVPKWARLGALALLSLVVGIKNFGGDLTNRHPTQAIAEAAMAIRATKPSGADRLFAVNRGLWVNAATDLDPPTPYIHPSHTLCEFDPRSGHAVSDALAAAPRYIVVADRRVRLSCERSESWDLIAATLRNRYRLIVHAAEDNEFYDVYERNTASEP